MNKYGRAGVALLGLLALGGLVSLLGGPNVFSTFSSSISTLFPESDTPALEEKPQEKPEEAPVVDNAEEPQKIEEIAQAETEAPSTSPVIGPEETQEPEQIIVEQPQKLEEKLAAPPKSAPVLETRVPSSPVPSLTKPLIPNPSGFVSWLTGIGQLFQGSGKFSSRRVDSESWGGGKHYAPRQQKTSGEEGSGGQCATPREVRWIKLGEKCEWNEY